MSESDVISFFHFLQYSVVPTDDFNIYGRLRDVINPYINDDFLDFLIYEGGIETYIFHHLPIYEYSLFWKDLHPDVSKQLLELIEMSDRDNFSEGNFEDLVITDARRDNNVVFIQQLRDVGLLHENPDTTIDNTTFSDLSD